MKISQFTKVVEDLTANPTKRPPMLWGRPGIGKSSVVRQVAKRQNRRMLDWRLVQKEAVDISGLPYVENGTTRYATPESLPKPGEGAILFLDEIVQAPTMVQNAVSELVLDRTIGGGTYRLPDDACIIAAGNRRTDKAATFEMPSHMRSRFRHFDLDVDTDDWAAWAYKAGVREEVIAFIRYRPNLLCADASPEEKVNPNPRTWEALSEDMEFASDNPKMAFEVYASAVGKGPAGEFAAYLRTFRDIPDPDLIFANPETAPVPDQPGSMWALGVALAARATKKNAPAMFTYLHRVSQDFAVVIASDALSRDTTLLLSKEATGWCTKHAKFLVGL